MFFCNFKNDVLNGLEFIDSMMLCYKTNGRFVEVPDPSDLQSMAEEKAQNKTLYAGTSEDHFYSDYLNTTCTVSTEHLIQ